MESSWGKLAVIEKMIGGSEYRLPTTEDMRMGTRFLMLDWSTAWDAVVDGKPAPVSGFEIELACDPIAREGEAPYVEFHKVDNAGIGIFHTEVDAFIGETVSDQSFPVFFLVKR